MQTQKDTDLQAALAKFDDIISGNSLLLDFMANVRRNGITEFIGEPTQSAYYASYDAYSDDGKIFLNAVKYRPDSLGRIEDMTEYKIHESYHGLQLSKSAALHAHFNPISPVSFSPASSVALFLLMELDSYAKTSWLLSEIPATDLFAAPDRLAYRLKSVFKNAASLEKNLLSAATQARRHIRKDLDPNVDVFEVGYAKPAIDWFTGNPDDDYGDKIICRLDDDDIMELGSAFGPNLFAGIGASPSVNVLEPLLRLTEPTKKLLNDVTQRLGINEKSLPTMREALSKWGFSKQGFIDASRTNTLYGDPAP